MLIYSNYGIKLMYTTGYLADKFNITLNGKSSIKIEGVCGISDNLPNHLSFITNESMLSEAKKSNIPVFVCNTKMKLKEKTTLVHEEPNFIFIKIANLFQKSILTLGEQKQTTLSNNIASDAKIMQNVILGENITIGSQTIIYPNTVIGDRCKIGNNCIIYPNCTIREDTHIKNNVIIQAGACIGSDGFGFIEHKGKHKKIPQLGNVVIEDDVEIGSNTTIDRGRFTSTVIGSGSKIDNLVMIGHNVKIGKDCLVVSQVGISGSTVVGDRVTLAGQVGTVGHISICDDVIVLGKSGITKSITQPGIYAGMPIKPAKIWRKAVAKLYKSISRHNEK